MGIENKKKDFFNFYKILKSVDTAQVLALWTYVGVRVGVAPS